MIPPVQCSLLTPDHSSLGKAEPTNVLHPYRNTWQHMQQQDSNLYWLKKPVNVTCFAPVNSYIQNWGPQNYFTNTGVKGGPKMMQTYRVILPLPFFHAGSQEPSPALLLLSTQLCLQN